MHGLLLDVLSMAMVFNAILVITSRSPIVAVLFLIAVFVMAACYLATSGVIYAGLTYLVVYVGAVAVLFLFVIMMLNVRLSEVVSMDYEYNAGIPMGLAVALVFMLEAFSTLPSMVSWLKMHLSSALNVINSYVLGMGAPTSMGLNDVHMVFGAESADSSFTYLSQVQSLGLSLYTYGFLWLLLISFVLLLAMLGPIALCLRTRQTSV